MKLIYSRVWLIGLVGLLVSMSGSAFGQARQGLPPAEEIIKKAVARAKWSEAQNFENKYAYTRLAVSEKLDDKGAIKERRERLYHVFPINGVAYTRLIQKDGRPLSPEEQKKEQERESKFRQELSQNKRQQPDGEDGIAFNEELVSRYDFEPIGQEPITGRSTYVLTFKPKSNNLPEKRRMDRLLNKLAGKLWIDQKDYEIARVDAHLLEGVQMWGGILASIQTFQFRMEQSRVDEGVWLQSRFDGAVNGRYLLNSMHVKWAEQWSDFKKAGPEVGQVSGGRP